KKSVDAAVGRPEAVRTSESPVTEFVPVATRRPPVPNEFRQPVPGALGGPHGHVTPVPSPKQNGTGGGSRSVANEPFVLVRRRSLPAPVARWRSRGKSF